MKFHLIAALAACASIFATTASAEYYSRPTCHARELARMGDFQGARACRLQKRAWLNANGGRRSGNRQGGYYANAGSYGGDTSPPQSGSEAANDLGASMDRLVAYDAQSWAVNSYIPGSITNLHYNEQPDGSAVVIANYNYMNPFTNSALGWVKLYLADGVINCIEYHDYPGKCRAVGASPGRQQIVEDVAGVLAKWYMAD